MKSQTRMENISLRDQLYRFDLNQYTYVIILFSLHNNMKTPLGNLTICRTIFPNQYVVNDGERQCKQNSRFLFLFSRLCGREFFKKKKRKKKNVDDSERREKREVCCSNLQKSTNFRLKRSISHTD